MRLSHIALLGLIALPLPAMAQVPDGKAVFGNNTCTKPVPCDDGLLSSEQWAALGNQCVTTSFSYTNPNGFFEPYAGLNSNKCLTPRPNPIDTKVGSPLIPYCCIVPYKENACLINCKIAR